MPRHRRRARAAVAPLAALVLAGCTSVAEASRDDTNLVGNVPIGLGPRCAVRIAGCEAALASDLFVAFREQLVGRDLFDRLEPATTATVHSGTGTSRLDVVVVGAVQEELLDPWTIDTSLVSRIDVDVALRDGAGRVVLYGRVTGVGVDGVTESDQLDAVRREDARIASLHDAAAKVGRVLRRAAVGRTRAATAQVRPIVLPRGTGTVALAVLGVDDAENARRLHGQDLAEALAVALGRLGPDVRVVPRAEVRRALDEPAEGAAPSPAAARRYRDGREHLVETVALGCDAALFVVGEVRVTGGRVSAEVDVVDRRARVVFTRRASAEGLGALGVVAADLAREVGAGLAERPPP